MRTASDDRPGTAPARARLRPHDWASFATIAAAALAIAAVIAGAWAWAGALVAGTVAAGALARRWSHRRPGPMPYSLRWVLFFPRGPHAPRRLQALLEPRAGERVLEIGPGIGIHALPVASALAPRGRLDVLDAQPEMLAGLAERARRAGVDNIVAVPGDAGRLPYPDATFDGAYLIGVLGEIPDQGAALRELRRVLKPDGRLVIGEILLDPDCIGLGTLRAMLAEAGFAFERHVGPRAAFLARFRR